MLPQLPFKDLLYNLDLCIFAYHTYHQTVVCPLDPFYEQIGVLEDRLEKIQISGLRNAYMAETKKAIKQGEGNFGNRLYHGPGTLQGQALNENLDPIITCYSQINPWIPSFMKADDTWEYIQPVKSITNKIKTVYLCRYTSAANSVLSKDIQIDTVRTRPSSINSSALDEMYCFEGGTGALEEENTVHAWSMLGFVLVENHNTGYNIHIVFRGSRSGFGARSFTKGITAGTGNPDWVSNMDFTQYANGEFCRDTQGQVHRGFAKSIHNTSPIIFACLNAIHTKKGGPPQRISVTGHSLGGGLAIMFTSGIMIGGYGPYIKENLTGWPWPQLELMTFSAPPVGNRVFANQLNSTSIFRVCIAGDPIVRGLNPNACHVGNLIEVTGPGGLDAHEFDEVRKALVTHFNKTFGSGVISTVPDDNSIINRCSSFYALWQQHGPTLNFSYINEFRQYLLLYLSCLAAMFESRGKDPALIKNILDVHSAIKNGYNTVFDQSTKFSNNSKLNNLLIFCLLLLRLVETGANGLNMDNIRTIQEI